MTEATTGTTEIQETGRFVDITPTWTGIARAFIDVKHWNIFADLFKHVDERNAEIKRLEDITTDEMRQAIMDAETNVLRYGGGFDKALIEAFIKSDGENTRRLYGEFEDFITKWLHWKD